MTVSIEANRPEPILITKKPLVSFGRTTDVLPTIKVLESGNPVMISTFYSDGLLLLKEVHMHLTRKLPTKTFKEQRTYRSAYHKLSHLVLIEIIDSELSVKKAPHIGWLKKLYPRSSTFTLSFPEVQGLNSSWQWYQNGITIPQLRNKIHPYYGTYFPTRFDHLILFDNWLKRYTGPKKTAIDVGIGSGVLTLQMIKHGFQMVFGTDSNPNAIIGLAESLAETKLSRKIQLDHGHLFGMWDKPTELIVFNPPWLPEDPNHETNDGAIYYNENLFPDFFEEAKNRLLPDGKLVILFSNLAQITGVTKAHPINQELANGGRFQLDMNLNKKVKAASDKTKRDQHWRATEEVELWVLIHKS